MAHTCCTGVQTKLIQFSEFPDTQLAYNCSLDVFAERLPHRSTGIVCTIGPACNTVEMISQMITAGMVIARFNFSHGSHEDHKKMMDLVRQASQKMCPHSPIALALDTKGPEIRTGMNKDGANITLSRDDTVVLTTDESLKQSCTSKCIFLDYKSLCKSVVPGQIILLADGSVELSVQEVRSNDVVCRVICGATFGSRKNACIPLVETDLPALSEKDKDDVRFGVEQNVDIIFASFIRNADNVRQLRSILDETESGRHIKIVSKIENYEGINNIEEIIDVSDGIMIARGDMGMDIDISRVTVAQKKITALCMLKGVPVICATQMLESMIEKSRPTRSEVADVTNAVADGVDCVMLSGESANGKYPLLAVQTMSSTCQSAERMIRTKHYHDEVCKAYPHPNESQSLAMGAVSISFSIQAVAIITLSRTGKTAYMISMYHPRCPIICVTRSPSVARSCRLFRGLIPLLYTSETAQPWSVDVDNRLKFGIEHADKMGILRPNGKVLFVTGWKTGPGSTNCIRIASLGEK